MFGEFLLYIHMHVTCTWIKKYNITSTSGNTLFIFASPPPKGTTLLTFFPVFLSYN